MRRPRSPCPGVACCSWYLNERTRPKAALLCIVLLMIAANLPAGTWVNGKVIDAVSGHGVAAARISVGAEETHSKGNGSFSLFLPLDDGQGIHTIEMSISHEDYDRDTHDILIRDGESWKGFYECELLPLGLTNCRNKGGLNKVLVGHFLSPVSQTLTNLPYRITQLLERKVLVEFGDLHLDLQDEPSFLACPEAQLQSPRKEGARMAGVLNAHALVTGNVKPTSAAGYDVRIYVCDSHEAFKVPPDFLNQAIDLDDPVESELNPLTHAAIITALVAGFEKEEKWQQAVKAANVALQILGKTGLDEQEVKRVKPVVETIRARCQSNMSHNRLVAGGAP